MKKCPAITEHVRIKTTFKHPGGLDVDAIEAIQNYLNFRQKKTGQVMRAGKPLFINKQNEPITTNWMFQHFFKLAKRSGVLRKLPELNAYNVDSHEGRDLLKSVLILCGCAEWAANIAIGHKPDSYEKVEKLFDTQFRAEYAKCSRMINMFSKISSIVDGKEIPKDAIDKISEDFEKKSKNYESKIESLEERLAIQENQNQRLSTSIDMDELTRQVEEKILKRQQNRKVKEQSE